MGDETLFWTKVAAIGQVAGAIATFLAALIALYFSRSERLIRLRVTAKFGRVVDPLGQTPAVLVEVENVGVRAARITAVGWTTGYSNRIRLLPKLLRLKSVFQVPDHEWHVNERLPWVLEPGEAKLTAFRRDDFISNMMERGGLSLFRLLPWRTGATLFRHRVTVGVSTRKTVVFGKVDKAISKVLENTFAAQTDAMLESLMEGAANDPALGAHLVRCRYD